MNDKDNYFLPFPRRLRSLFDEARANQQEIADYVGVSRQAVSQWMNGKTTPDCYNFKKVAEFFNVPLEYLYGDTDSKVRENILLSDNLGLSDEAVEAILSLKNTPYLDHIDPNDNNYPSKSEIFSDIAAGSKFWEMVEYLQNATMEYRNHEKALDRESGAIPDVLGVEDDERKELSLGGKAIMDADKMAIFCVYQAVDAFKKIVEGLPESYWHESIGLSKRSV